MLQFICNLILLLGGWTIENIFTSKKINVVTLDSFPKLIIFCAYVNINCHQHRLYLQKGWGLPIVFYKLYLKLFKITVIYEDDLSQISLSKKYPYTFICAPTLPTNTDRYHVITLEKRIIDITDQNHIYAEHIWYNIIPWLYLPGLVYYLWNFSQPYYFMYIYIYLDIIIKYCRLARENGYTAELYYLFKIVITSKIVVEDDYFINRICLLLVVLFVTIGYKQYRFNQENYWQHLLWFVVVSL